MAIGVLVLLFFSLRAVLGASPSPHSRSDVDSNGRADRLALSVSKVHLPAPVSRGVVVRDGSNLLLLGGLTTGDVSTGEVVRIDPRAGSAVPIATLAVPVHDAAGAVLDGRPVVFGGGSFSTVGAVQSLASGAQTSNVVGTLPVPRSDLSAVTLGGLAYVLGGFDGNALVPDVLATSDGVHFRDVGKLAQPVRYGAVASLDRDVFVVGGALGTSEGASAGGETSDIQRFDSKTGMTTVIGHLPVELAYASAFVLRGQLFVAGGRTPTAPSSRIFQVDPKSGAVRVVGTLSSPRSDAAVAVLGDTAYLIGGETTGPAAPLDSVLVAHLMSGSAPADGSTQVAASRAQTDHANRAVKARTNIYAFEGPDMLSPAVRHVPYRIYVPESASSYVDVIDPYTYKVIDRYYTGLDPQHVIPAWTLKTLYAANDLGNTLTPISPMTGRPEGPDIHVTDPYNMYFTPSGKYAIVVEEANQVLAFRNPKTFALKEAVHVNCPGIDHGDFSADGSFAIFSCEFSGRMVKVTVVHPSVMGYLTIPGTAPQDVKLTPMGKVFYTADLNHGGVYLISAVTFKVVGFIPTGTDAHGLYVSRTAKYLYVTNRGSGSVSVVDFATRKVKTTWRIPGGGSPDMGNLSPNGKVLWLSGRYNACVYAISTVTGRLLAEIPVPNMPHGLLPWPQPGRFSIGHTGIMR